MNSNLTYFGNFVGYTARLATEADLPKINELAMQIVSGGGGETPFSPGIENLTLLHKTSPGTWPIVEKLTTNKVIYKMYQGFSE